MLKHGYPSYKKYYERNKKGKNKIIELKRIHLNGVEEKVIYEQFIFDKETGEFINWQSAFDSCKNWK